ncbi:MAG: SAM-dependent methyltransferase [Cyanobacteria bacterium QH_8_48_120]|jgi:MPBQ/MSBQ methyltransferase|nr:MAG: SAM-dependent methyltransferase [Cyanobacteria bacterium QH_1_48_107]PSO58415.1 MAG: SAM-dependent methyltransferase [Cyanobacteria bacterium QH_10_48_56]PSO59814.1 MAG: SAM-dependent methyltransferase [Cyanobacteria bacterium QH_2_48_84]PSO62915.1 MAG: SAM-dependent methyltransferase [Cyanobacteria bacterium QH_6_48_35]PSO67690.1 MAG: SAM-dependent methyltransferase [Cyanobacteria bacterium QH_7_48_89]PSO72820.1 MAG: SAM-dependent methyltransferase [Cyanobacteria bacterium QS_1_48_34]
MRLIQHKKEAYWFYRFVSLGYDDYINPFFWNESMRAEALELAQLDRQDLQVVDVGAGSGFTTEGIVEKVNAQSVTMLDQSPHQLGNANKKSALHDCQKLQGDAEDLPFPTDTFDRYVSAGSIEYWPEPQRAIAEAYRVIKPGGIALIIGPLQRRNSLARWLSNTWMLFPTDDEYTRWYKQAGFSNIQKVYVAPNWYQDETNQYAIAIAGVKPAAGESPIKLEPKQEDVGEAMTPARWLAFSYRFVVGTVAGAFFVPIAMYRTLQEKLQRLRR